MKSQPIPRAVLSACAFLGGLCAFAQPPCPPLQDTDKARLIDYVHKKYQTPTAMRLEIADAAAVNSACYRKLVFKAVDPKSAFRLELYVAPDLRFLARDLLDTAVDPVAEARKKAETLAAGLDRPGMPARGKPGAPVTIAVFSDFQCPYCAQFAATMKEIPSADADKVRLVFHHFPLRMHPWARPAAEAAACAQQQGDSFFWRVHDYLFDHQKNLSAATLQPKLAEFTRALAGFDEGKFASCLVGRKTAAQIDEEVTFAEQNGVQGTPTAFLNGRKTQIVTAEQLRTLIRELGEKTAAPKNMP